MAATGMRPGTEAEFLEWRHIDVEIRDGQPVLHFRLQRGKRGARNFVAHNSCWLLLERLRAPALPPAGGLLSAFLTENRQSLAKGSGHETCFYPTERQWCHFPDTRPGRTQGGVSMNVFTENSRILSPLCSTVVAGIVMLSCAIWGST